MRKRKKEIAIRKATSIYNDLLQVSELCGNPFMGYCCYPKKGFNKLCEDLLKELEVYSKLLKKKLYIRIPTKEEDQ